MGISLLMMCFVAQFAITTGKDHLKIIENFNTMIALRVVSECDTLTITGYSILDKTFSLNNGAVISQNYAVSNIYLGGKTKEQ